MFGACVFVIGFFFGGLVAMGLCHVAGHRPWWSARTWRERSRSGAE